MKDLEKVTIILTGLISERAKKSALIKFLECYPEIKLEPSHLHSIDFAKMKIGNEEFPVSHELKCEYNKIVETEIYNIVNRILENNEEIQCPILKKS